MALMRRFFNILLIVKMTPHWQTGQMHAAVVAVPETSLR